VRLDTGLGENHLAFIMIKGVLDDSKLCRPVRFALDSTYELTIDPTHW